MKALFAYGLAAQASLVLFSCSSVPDTSVVHLNGCFDMAKEVEFSVQSMCPYSVGKNVPDSSFGHSSDRLFSPESLRWIPYEKTNARGCFSTRVEWKNGARLNLFGVSFSVMKRRKDSMAIAYVDSLRELHVSCVAIECKSDTCAAGLVKGIR